MRLKRRPLAEARDALAKTHANLVHCRREFFAKEAEALELQRKLNAIISVRVENLFHLDPDIWQVSVRIDKRIIRLSERADLVEIIANDIYHKLIS